jgi:threonine/homoserine/homoserine lactone efflux protein
MMLANMMLAADVIPLLKGFGIGAAIAAPVGPMSVLCMRRTMTQGWRMGFGTGAGIATGDAMYALVAALGLAGVTRFMLAHERPLHFLAGVFLASLAWRTLVHGPNTKSDPTASNGTAGPSGGVTAAFGSALLLTLTNPPTIISFIAIFTALAPSGGFDPRSGLATVAGVFLGSVAWWALLTALVTGARHVAGPGIRGWLDRISAAALGALGVAEIRRAL